MSLLIVVLFGVLHSAARFLSLVLARSALRFCAVDCVLFFIRDCDRGFVFCFFVYLYVRGRQTLPM